VVAGKPEGQPRWSEEQLKAELQRQVSSGEPAARLAASLVKPSGWSRREIYQLVLEIQGKRDAQKD
jgi:hypothetical protein